MSRTERVRAKLAPEVSLVSHLAFPPPIAGSTKQRWRFQSIQVTLQLRPARRIRRRPRAQRYGSWTSPIRPRPTPYFPIVNGSDIDFVHPFAMTILGNPADQPFTPIIMQHLTGNPGSVPANQLWGAAHGTV